MIQFNFITSGDKSNPPVIFLHGFLGSAQDWEKIISVISDKYYCLALDLPGHGRTTFPDIPEDLFLNQFASHLETFITTQQLSNPWVVGYSMGGRLAMHLLFQKPAICKGFVLESASPGIEDIHERESRLVSDLKLADELEQAEMESFLKKWYDQPIFNSFRNHPDFSLIFKNRMNNNPQQLARALRAMTVGRQKSFWPQIKKVSKPVLYVAGDLDQKYTIIANRIAEICPAVSLEIVAEAGHNVNLGQPEEYTRIVQKFFDRYGQNKK